MPPLRRKPSSHAVGWLDVAGQTAALLTRSLREQPLCLENREHWREVLTRKDIIELSDQCRENQHREEALALVAAVDGLASTFLTITKDSICEEELYLWFSSNQDDTPGGDELVAFSTTGWFGERSQPLLETDTLTLCLHALLLRARCSKFHIYNVVLAPRWVWRWLSVRPLHAGRSSDWAHLFVGPCCPATGSELELAVPLWHPGTPGLYESLEAAVIAARNLESLSRERRTSR